MKEYKTTNEEIVSTVIGVTNHYSVNYVTVNIIRFDGTKTSDSFFDGELNCMYGFMDDNIIADSRDIVNKIKEEIKDHLKL